MIDKAIFSLPGIKKVLCILAGLSFLRAFIIIGQAWSLSSAITNLWYGGNLYDQGIWLAIFLVCFIGKQGVLFLQEKYLDSYAYEQADSFRQELLHKVFTAGSPVVQASGTGNITTAVLEGVDQVETYFRLILPKITSILIIPPTLLVVAFILDWVSGLVLLIVFPAIILYMIILGHTAKDKAAKQHKTFRVLSNHFIDSLRGIETLKLFGISKSHGKTIFEVSEQNRTATMRTLKVANLSSLALDLFATLSLAAAAILLGLRLLDGTLILFPALMILVLAPEYFKPIREFAADYHASLDGKNALSSIQAIIDQPEEEVIEKPLTPWCSDSHLTVDSIDYSYPDFKALENISFEASGFRKTGIVGTSGSGKSTLINLLSGFYSPEKGDICINESSVDSFKQADWQKQVIYIPQDPYIFHASLRENIAFYHPQSTDKEITQAVELVGLQSLVEELPKGLDTKIGEGARSLSGGQAQRIALARAFLDKSRKILLFDEPTAHLDIETELELKEKMLPLMQDRLVFFATHRLHWMHEMDTILVMEGGRVVETGTLEELKSRNGEFTQLTSRMNRGEL